MRLEAVLEQKKIIVATHDVVFPVRGGGALRTFKAAQAFAQMGHDVEMIVPAEDNVRDCEMFAVKAVKAPTKQRSQILSAVKFNLHLLLTFLKYCKKADCIFVHNTIAAVFLPVLKKFFGFGFFLDITDIHAEYLIIGHRSLFEKILTPFLLKYEYWIIKSADAVSVATQSMKHLLINKGICPERIEVIYDGVDIQRFSADKQKNAECALIHLGAVDRQHGVELAVRALAVLKTEIDNLRLYIVGGGRELDGVKKLSRSLGVEHLCVFTGSVKFDQAPEYLQKASIGLILRPDFLPNRIITTLKIFDYWASGTAVVAPKLDGISEIAQDGENVLLFKPGDIKDIARCIALLLKDSEKCRQLAQCGCESAREFGFDAAAKRICDFALKNAVR